MHLMGLRPAAPLDGRVLSEALVDGDDAASVVAERETLEASDGGYRERVHLARVGGARYVDFGAAERA